jgi:hypothetical protein
MALFWTAMRAVSLPATVRPDFFNTLSYSRYHCPEISAERATFRFQITAKYRYYQNLFFLSCSLFLLLRMRKKPLLFLAQPHLSGCLS